MNISIRKTNPDNDRRGPLHIMMSGRPRVYRSFKAAMDDNPALFYGHTYGDWYMSLMRERLRAGVAVDLNGTEMVAINRLKCIRLVNRRLFKFKRRAS